jgi:hypothetical protein
LSISSSRITGFIVAQRAHQAAGQRADVRAPVAADLGLVAHTAERHAHELAAHRAGDRLADRGLAGAGRADQREDRTLGVTAALRGARTGLGLRVVARRVRPGPCRLRGTLGAQLAHGDVLDDPVLDVLETGVVGVEDLARARRIEVLLGALAPRDRDHPLEVGADHLRLAAAALLAHPLEPAELALDLLAHVLGHLRLGDLRAQLVVDRRVVLAELAADRLHLLAQHVLALLLGGALLDVVADPPAHLQLGEPLALVPERQLEALGHVGGLEQLHLLREGQIRRVAGGVGERPGLDDRAHPGRDAPVVAAQLEDLLDDRAVLAHELARAAVDRGGVGRRRHLDAQVARGVGARGAGDASGQALEHRAGRPAGQADAVGDTGDRADGGVLAVVARHQQDLLVVAHGDREREVHGREDDGVVERDQQQRLGLGHGVLRGAGKLRAQL